jgi:hypothetical protein
MASKATEHWVSRSSFADPVFVLCNGRSGSTLLRFLLDAHPELACPPETNLPALCGQLATVWSLIEGAPLSANRGDEPPEIPDTAISGIRETVDRMLSSYLKRRGKRRYCDKSLGTARFAELLMRVYPKAQFICLYRHPMDVIASGLEACPWGLSGYGFDPYIASTPGNEVLALARFWADNAATTLAAEERFPDQSLRVRYEDLVADPEETAEEIFRFIGVSPVPGISATCFSPERERFGPGDHKIWYTPEISRESIGRGWSIPAEMIGPQVLANIRELTEKLGYLPVDDSWGTSAPPTDVRLSSNSEDHHAIELPAELTLPAPPEGSPPHSQVLGERLQAGLAQASDETDHWETCAAESMLAISVPDDPGRPTEYWLVDLQARTVSLTSHTAQEKSDWDIIGSTTAWNQVLTGKLNLSVALRACQLRYCDNGENENPLIADSRIGILADLLDIANWRHRRAHSP